MVFISMEKLHVSAYSGKIHTQVPTNALTQ